MRVRSRNLPHAVDNNIINYASMTLRMSAQNGKNKRGGKRLLIFSCNVKLFIPRKATSGLPRNLKSAFYKNKSTLKRPRSLSQSIDMFYSPSTFAKSRLFDLYAGLKFRP